MDSATQPQPGSPTLHAFKADSRAPQPVHPLENALVGVAAAHLAFLAWAFGGMQAWTQWAGLGFGVAALALSLWPRRYDGAYAPGKLFILHTWPKLVRFPVFWLGLVLLIYIALQALNPAMVMESDERGWWMEPVAHLGWLPSGVDVPLSGMNPWRVLVTYASIWMLVCALWIGLTRRASVQTVLTLLVANGTALALVGILERVTDTRKILWLIPAKTHYFVATFPYKNHAGAYFNLIAGLAAALMVWHYLRGVRRMRRGSPAPIYVFCLAILGMIVMLSFSRSAAFLFLAYVVVGGLAYGGWLMVSREGGNHVVSLTVALLLACFVGVAGWFLKVNESFDRMHRLFERDTRASITGRREAAGATLEMAQDKLPTGWGAASFRYIFPAYQANHPELLKPSSRGKLNFWEYAHNDYVQGLAELGFAGMVLVLGMLGWWLRRVVRAGVFRHPAALLLLAGLGVTLVHSWVDFQAHCPAILATWCAAWPLLTRWLECEHQR